MSHPELTSGPRSSDYDFTAGLHFLGEFAKHLNSRHLGHHRFDPRFDLEDHDQSYELYGEVPGFDKENITVEANDDRNIQISGSIPRRHDDTTSSTAETSAALSMDPYVQVQHHDVPQRPHHPPVERFGEVLNPDRVPPSDGPVVPQSLPSTDSTIATPHHKHEAETARFGDVLDPHAKFVHGQKAKPKVRYLVAERQYGQFHRVFHFPGPIKKDEVSARMDNGILHISAPKAEVPPPTKVEIKKVSKD